jgi:hypothetical protein
MQAQETGEAAEAEEGRGPDNFSIACPYLRSEVAALLELMLKENNWNTVKNLLSSVSQMRF